MIDEIMRRWTDLGKPLFMVPKDFKEKILQSMDQEIKFNYLKWLTQGLEIDMFEILTDIILYSRCDQEDKFQSLFDLYCYTEEIFMKIEEFRFFIEKSITIISTTLSLKRQYLFDIYKAIEQKIFQQGKEQFSKNEFMKITTILSKELASTIDEIGTKFDSFAKQIKKHRLPSYLEQDNLFLGKYMIKDIMAYNQIIEKNLLQYESVFVKPINQIDTKRNSLSNSLLVTRRQSNLKIIDTSHRQSNANNSMRRDGVNDQDALNQTGRINDAISQLMSLSNPRNIDDNKLEMSKSNAFAQSRYQTLFNLWYCFRIKTEAIFEPEKRDYIFDFFILDDSKFDEFYLFKNIWRETLLLNSLTKKGFSNKINSVHNFGILPSLMLPEDGDNLSIFDARVRNKNYIAPEQIKLGLELDMILSGHNGKLDETNPEVIEYHLANKAKINKQCDIYAVGAILYRLLMSNPPNLSISEYIAKKRLNEKSPDSNVYEVPYFFKDYILSNDMCYLLIRLLHQNPKYRFSDLEQVKEELLKLRENIYSTPPMLRKILGHPILPNESYQQQALPKIIEFKNSKMNEFSLKYLAKFIYEQNVEQISINGGAMPLMPLKNHLLIELNLRDQNLYSEDLFILSQFLRHNNSVTHINLSKQSDILNLYNLGTQSDINMLKRLFYDSLGIEHFSIALENTSRLKTLDLSENDLGSQNFKILLKIFNKNNEIELLNIADCKLDGNCSQNLCKILQQTNSSLKYLYFRNSNIGDQGAEAVSELIKDHKTLIELEVFNCGITEKGGHSIGDALKTNFCIEKLSIGENILNKRDVEQIQQSVIFNTQYNQMKQSNKKFEGFAHNLIAESLKRWASQSNFVAAKLQERLQCPLDELDEKIAEVMFDSKMQMDLKGVPQKYEYSSGDGKIDFGSQQKQ
eukprot:403341144